MEDIVVGWFVAGNEAVGCWLEAVVLDVRERELLVFWGRIEGGRRSLYVTQRLVVIVKVPSLVLWAGTW